MADEKKISNDFEKSQLRHLNGMFVTQPKDALYDAYISAGRLLEEMDISAGRRAYDYVGGRCVTVGIDEMSFPKPVMIGDEVTIYTEPVYQGTSSVTLKVEAFARRRGSDDVEKVTESLFTFVHTDDDGKPIPIKTTPPKSIEKQRKSAKKTFHSGAAPTNKPPEDSMIVWRVVPRPADRNYLGDIFGGWLLQEMDKAGLNAVSKFTGRDGATRALEAMTFNKPVHVGDELTMYAKIIKKGRTSLAIEVETWARRKESNQVEKVTEGIFTYVTIGQNKQPVPFRVHDIK